MLQLTTQAQEPSFQASSSKINSFAPYNISFHSKFLAPFFLHLGG